MKITLAQLNYDIGNFEKNTNAICNAIKKAKLQNADIVVFAELAVCGYPPRDYLNFSDFIRHCNQSVKIIAQECKDIAAIVGTPTVNPDVKGKDLFNSAVFIYDQKIVSVHHKSLLPTYDIFDEYRYFEPNKVFSLVKFKEKNIAITICEDLWNLGDDPLYTFSPMDKLSALYPDFVINIAASPFHYNQAELRKKILSENAAKYNVPVFYVNHQGAQTELLFDGGSVVVAPDGNIYDELKYFEEDLKIFDLEEVVGNNKKSTAIQSSQIKQIYEALVMGVRDYFQKLGFKKAILGLSGGIDSALTMAIASEALGSENVYALLMPSKFSTPHSVDDAVKLSENLGSPYEIITIEEAYNAFDSTLKPYFKDLPFNVAEENLQARIRAVILMAMSNKFGYIVLNTSNKSEAAVGYGTLYGDMCGAISVIGDVYKTQVYELSRYVNREKEIIPVNIINKAPSAELRPGQKDSDSLPEYSILDKILFEYIENTKSPGEIIKMGFDETTVLRSLKLVNSSEYKRYQCPPILRISPKAFGMGRRMPITGKYLT